mmetsp:Transcript_91826/g.291355  ORF Transcript_91826/g.291355 Transcript_91826/m.291355 type:complete len:170 (-) Transcript_91826:115-624(-)
MRRTLSRPKYQLPDYGAREVVRMTSAPVRSFGYGDEDSMEAGLNRLRRSGEHPKRLCPLDAATGRFAFRSNWPELEVPARDVEAFNAWCYGVEEALAQSFQDARCPYRFLEPKKHVPRAEQAQAQQQVPGAWSFRDFQRECDFPDGEQFGEWCEAMEERRLAKRRASEA